MKKIDLRKEARGRPCTARIWGVCKGRHDTSVLAHLPSKQKGIKADDRHACIACYECHKWLDEDWVHNHMMDEDSRMLIFLEAVIRTQKVWIKGGLM